MAYYVGDIPVEDLVIEPAQNGEPLDLTPFNLVTAVLRDPERQPVPEEFFAAIDGEEIVVEWPDSTPFAADGLYELELTLEHSTLPQRLRLAPVRIVAQGDNGWHTVDSARDGWDDAPDADADLYELLELAKEAVIEYAPVLAEGEYPPLRYRKGQRMHAENIWNACRVNPASGGDGDGTFVLRPFPLDWQVKQMLRPKRAVPVIG